MPNVHYDPIVTFTNFNLSCYNFKLILQLWKLSKDIIYKLYKNRLWYMPINAFWDRCVFQIRWFWTIISGNKKNQKNETVLWYLNSKMPSLVIHACTFYAMIATIITPPPHPTPPKLNYMYFKCNISVLVYVWLKIKTKTLAFSRL